jgi:integrase/recombinase XerC
MNEAQALTTIVESSHVELAVSGWLHAHEKSVRTHKAYAQTLDQFRRELHKIGKDLDADVQTIMLVAQAFASASSKKARASDNTQNVRLAILCSFFDYAIERFLLMPMDHQGHVLNPIKVIDRAKVEPYHHISWLETEEATKRLKLIDRSTLQGKRDYALLAILLFTGRRLQEIASLHWQHVHIQGAKITLIFEHCKGDKTMRDELPAGYSKALLEWLHAYYGASVGSLAGDTPLWVSLTVNTKQYGQPLGIRAIERLCIKHLEVHTHVTRHSFAHAMIKAGATLPELQDRLGHNSLATTGIYARVFTGAKNPHADKLAELFGIE